MVAALAPMGIQRRFVACLALAACGSLAAGAGSNAEKSHPAHIGLPDELPSEPRVKDPVFAVLVGLVAADHYGALTRGRLESHLGPRAQASRLPYREMREVSRMPEEPAPTSAVTIVLDRPLKLPIPYSILGYHPGSVEGGPACVFREWSLGAIGMAHGGTRLELTDVRLFGLREGRLFVDIDGWLDRLAGRLLDDSDLEGLALFRHEGRWLGIGFGHNPRGEPRSGLFDFARDRVVLPLPGEMRTVARFLRARAAALMSAASEATPPQAAASVSP